MSVHEEFTMREEELGPFYAELRQFGIIERFVSAAQELAHSDVEMDYEMRRTMLKLSHDVWDMKFEKVAKIHEKFVES